MITYVDIHGTGRISQLFDRQVVIVEGELRLQAEQLCGFE